MLSIPSFEVVGSLGSFLQQSGYNIDRLADELGLSEGLWADQSNLPSLLAKTEGGSLLAVLARLLFAGLPVGVALCRRVLPADFIANAQAAGLLVEKDENYEPQATIVPFANFLVACDAPRLTTGQMEMVVGPGRATLAIARLAISGRDERTLDIGSGTGVLALDAARYSREVIGVDLSTRANQFAEFSAALNGVRHVRFLAGDGLAPVAGQTFTRILANPPFFLGPVKTYTFSDSPLELDGFSRRLAREAPAQLAEGGYFQMISEWVEVRGQTWTDRIRDWTGDSGCDVLINIGFVSTALQYAEKRFGEAKMLYGERSADSFQNHLNYFAGHKVENVLLGVITMRKRTGKGPNWFSVIPACPVDGDVRGALTERIDTITYAAEQSADQLLAARFRIAPDCALQQRLAPGPSGWQLQFIDLLKTSPFDDRLRLDAQVVGIVQVFDGTRTLEQIAGQFATQAGISIDQARQHCIQLCRRLLQNSFILPAH